MARKSRKPPIVSDIGAISPKYKYTAGAYLRISVENDTSINIQKLLINDFLKLEEDISLYKFYIDNDVSSFDDKRPAFEELIKDAAGGVINCIVVKDLSRFGRNYIETGDYISQVFPACGIRFISLFDNYDSKKDIGGPSIGMILTTIVNSSYSYDISSKVKSAIRTKQVNGKYIAARLIYGYKKCFETDETSYSIDEKAAEVVSGIFSWALSGESAYAIAGKLNALEIPSPYEHKVKSGEVKPLARQQIWTERTVADILRNRSYTGCFIAGKYQTISGRIKKAIRAPEDEWIVINDHHPLIISMECFEIVQSILIAKKHRDTQRLNKCDADKYLSDKLFCGICGRKMKRRVLNQKTYYACPRSVEVKNGCIGKMISAIALKSDIFDYIQMQIEQAEDYREKQMRFEKSFAFTMRENYINDNLRELSLRLSNLESSKADLFDKVSNESVYTIEDYMSYSAYNSLNKQALENEIKQLEKEQADYSINHSPDSWWVTDLLSYKESEELTEDMYNGLLGRILVFRNYTEIQLKYREL